MVTIRLKKLGKRNAPFYRIVATDKARKNAGQELAILGYWHPDTNETKIDKKAIDQWVQKGAQVSSAVNKLIA